MGVDVSLQMTSAPAQWKLYTAAGVVALASELAWLCLAPLYEEGSSVFVTPLLCLLGVAFAWLYLKRSHWAYQFSPYYALGTGVVMGIFIGESSDFYGAYALPMAVVEAGVLASSIAIFVAYFLPAIKGHFNAAAN